MNQLRQYRAIGWSLLLSVVLPTLITLLLTGDGGWPKVLGWAIFFGGLSIATSIATRSSALDCADWLRRLWKRS